MTTQINQLKERDEEALKGSLRLWDQYCESAQGRALGSISIGSSSALEVLKYELTDRFHKALFSGALPNSYKNPSRLLRLRQTLLRASWSRATVTGILNSSLSGLGHAIEVAQLYKRSRGFRPGQDLIRAEILLCGYLTSGPHWAPDVIARLESQFGLRALVIRIDDYFADQKRLPWGSGLKHIDCAGYAEIDDFRWAADLGLQVRRALTFESTLDFDGSSELRSFLHPSRFSAHLRRVAFYFSITSRLIERVKPKLLAIPDEREPLALALGACARSDGRVVVSIPQGEQFVRPVPPLENASSDLFLVMSPEVKQFFGRAGLEEKRILVAEFSDTCPRFQSRRVSRRGTVKTVLYPCQALDDEADTIRALASIIDKIEGASLVVRPHPTQSERWLKIIHPTLNISRRGTGLEALEKADLLVTQFSFMAVEAFLLGCPILLWNQDRYPKLLSLLLTGRARWAGDLAALEAQVRAILREEAQTRHRAEFMARSLHSIFEELLYAPQNFISHGALVKVVPKANFASESLRKESR